MIQINLQSDKIFDFFVDTICIDCAENECCTIQQSIDCLKQHVAELGK